MNWLMNLLIGKRSHEDVLISTLDTIAFIALHAQSHDDLVVALSAYRAVQREAKAGRLEALEHKLKIVAEQVGKDIEQAIAKRGRACNE